MIAARLLAVAGSGGSVVVPTPSFTVHTLTSSPHGGWTMIPDSKASHYNGKTWVGWITSAGAVEIGEWDGATFSTTVLALASDWLNADTHGSPSVLVRDSDKKLLVFASRHDGTTPYIWTSTNPEDASAFPGAATPGATIGASDYTYMSTFQLLAETSDPIYLFYRDEVGGSTGRMGYSKSTDGGATWSSRVVFYTGASGRTPYWRMWSNGQDRVDFFTTDREWYDQANPSKVGHFYFTGGNFYQSDGTQITATQPFGFSDITLVHDNTDGMVWCTGVCNDGSGAAALLMVGLSSDTDNELRTARYRSGSWQIDTVGSHGGIYSGDRYGPGGAIDHDSPDVVWFSQLVSGTYELFRFTSADDGASWSSEQITTGSTEDNLWVETVRDAGDLKAVWLYGTFLSSTDTTSNTLGIMGATA